LANPRASGSTDVNLQLLPNLSQISDLQFDVGAQSAVHSWQFVDEAPSRWVRLTAAVAAVDLDNPMVDVNLPITFRVLLLPPGVSISQWRSMRTHTGAGSLPIVLSPSATGNGLNGPTVETRSGGVQRVEVDFAATVSGVNPAGVSVSDGTNSYPPTSVTAVDADTIAINFNAGQLPDQKCYTISLAGSTVAQGLLGDTDCRVRSLVGDTTSSGDLNLSDVIFTRTKVGQAATANVAHDVDLSGGNISAADFLFIKTGVTSPSKTATCP
jgi:hypothetical protein